MTAPAITTDPAVMGGKPCIAGARITVAHVLESLAHGMTVADYVASHPTATEDGVRAALSYAAAAVDGPPSAAA